MLPQLFSSVLQAVLLRTETERNLAEMMKDFQPSCCSRLHQRQGLSAPELRLARVLHGK